MAERQNNSFTGSILWTATDGDKGGAGINQHGDLYLFNAPRGMPTPLRALVAHLGKVLVLNFERDFQGGVAIMGPITLPDLPTAPAEQTFAVVIGADGKLYKK